MEEKKTPQADLENEKSVFLLMGFIVVLSLLFVAFEWRNEHEDYLDPAVLSNLFIDEPFEVEFELPKEEQVSDISENNVNKLQEIEIVGFDVKNEPLLEKEIVNKTAGSVVTTREGDVEKVDDDFPQEKKEEVVSLEVDTLPEFPGGRGELVRYIYQNLKYPSVAIKQRIEGRVVCSFIVKEDGMVDDVRLEKNVYVFLDDEALRVLREMPKWNPGKKNGKGVSVKCYVSVFFEL